MLEAALAGVAGRSRELELRLEALRLAIVFLDTAMMQELLGSAERFAGLAGRTQGERELLMHVAMHRFLTGGSAAAVLEPLERAVADGTIVAALGPDSMLLPFVIGPAYKSDRLDLARRLVEAQLEESARRGSIPGFVLGSHWRAWIALREGDAREGEPNGSCVAHPPRDEQERHDREGEHGSAQARDRWSGGRGQRPGRQGDRSRVGRRIKKAALRRVDAHALRVRCGRIDA